MFIGLYWVINDKKNKYTTATTLFGKWTWKCYACGWQWFLFCNKVVHNRRFEWNLKIKAPKFWNGNTSYNNVEERFNYSNSKVWIRILIKKVISEIVCTLQHSTI